MSDPIALCLAGQLSPEVALARLLLTGTAPDQIPARLVHHQAPGNPAWHRLHALAARADALESLAAMLREAEVDHDPTNAAPEAAIATIARIFDRAVARAPEASVAAYSLNDPAILAAATEEILAWLKAEALIAPTTDVLDLGCGIGRVAAALAPHCRSVLALDVSPGMIEEARRRHGNLPNLRFATTPGTGLADHPRAGFDLILSVDSFPYLVQAGIAEAHLQDAARLLRPNGALAILNLSYRGDPEADRADAARWATEGGWHLTANGTNPFTLWDGCAFLLRRPESA
ncbi:class I SAM-dependent methyltransferase [Pararoseomonas indoligenes]|uniref:Class I SAM-dependent methyltransferase n=1 Tax=Roseomonas indoligenes TaxID=2820811 RepID=A0A940S999_9PROT|nr:class I SAM-dependent methyltransferase [Pararoseomonas indoligenes]MBP0494922.1 class I SAM-dependent methyltransferase [Pararoseomonas indoligenes]